MLSLSLSPSPLLFSCEMIVAVRCGVDDWCRLRCVVLCCVVLCCTRFLTCPLMTLSSDQPPTGFSFQRAKGNVQSAECRVQSPVPSRDLGAKTKRVLNYLFSLPTTVVLICCLPRASKPVASTDIFPLVLARRSKCSPQSLRIRRRRTLQRCTSWSRRDCTMLAV